MLLRTSLLLLAFCAVALAAPTSASAQAQAPAAVSRDWAGRTINHRCQAQPGEAGLAGLKEALVRHELFKIGAAGKMLTGWYYGNSLRTAAPVLRGKSTREIDRSLRQHLVLASRRELTAAIIYDVGVHTGRATLCVWLVTAGGIVAAETVAIARGGPVPIGAFAETARSGLGVTRATLTRAPRPRVAGGGTLAIAQQPPTAPPIPPDQPAERAALAGLAESLLPPSIRRTILETGIARLLVLPVADFSTVPFYALPIDDSRQLIDVATVVMLVDVDALTSLLRTPFWRDRFSGARTAKLVVGDPDGSGDALEWAPLPGAAAEAREIAEITGSLSGPLLVGRSAMKREVTEALRSRDLRLIYFATHGIADAVDPLDQSFLLLTAGRLQAREIAAMGHDGPAFNQTPLVVMSACQSGLGKTFEGGTFGLARAWAKAGAAQVVTSLWDIGDASTKDIMTDFVRRMAHERQPPETALRHAMLEARGRGVPAGGWAGFAMFGHASE